MKRHKHPPRLSKDGSPFLKLVSIRHGRCADKLRFHTEASLESIAYQIWEILKCILTYIMPLRDIVHFP